MGKRLVASSTISETVWMLVPDLGSQYGGLLMFSGLQCKIVKREL